MNCFYPPKIIKNLYCKNGENIFLLLTVFISSASSQGWSKNDIQLVVRKVRVEKIYIRQLNILRSHSDVLYTKETLAESVNYR